MGKPEIPPTERLLLQRIRNRIIEYFELASSFDEQLEYQTAVPIAQVPAEIINQWEDCASLPFHDEFLEPVFSANEQWAVRQFHTVWQMVIDETPEPLPTLESLQKTEQWIQLRESAKIALATFRVRGRFSDDIELA